MTLDFVSNSNTVLHIHSSVLGAYNPLVFAITDLRYVCCSHRGFMCIHKDTFSMLAAVRMHSISSVRFAAVPSHLSDDRDSESVLCRLVLFISLVMKSLLAEQWAVMPPFNMDLGSSATATQRQTNAQTDGRYIYPCNVLR